jgi:antitoxin HicB
MRRSKDNMKLAEYLDLSYTITLRRDDEGDWIARVEELRGCTAHGATQAEALAELEQAKREWIQAALEDGIDIPEPEAEKPLPSGKWVQRVSRRLHRDLKNIAEAEGTSLNSLMEMIGARYVGEVRAREVGREHDDAFLQATTTMSMDWKGTLEMSATHSWEVLRRLSGRLPDSARLKTRDTDHEAIEHAFKR